MFKGNWGALIGALLVSIVISITGAAAAHITAQGPAGPQGPTGPQGIPGLTGTNGNAGDMGLTGDAGARGRTGATGAQGPQGPAGTDGTGGGDNSITYLKSSTPSDPDLTLATSGPFSLVGRCAFDSGSSAYIAEIVLHSSVDGALAADSLYGAGTLRAYEFSNSNTELGLAAAYSFVPFTGHVDTNMNTAKTFWAETPTDDLFITGEESAVVRHANTSPVCTYSGYIKSIAS